MNQIYEKIKEVCGKRKEEKRFPPSVSFYELMSKTTIEETELRRHLNGLYKLGMIDVYKTINGIGIEVKEKDEKEK